jgi:hypothetical protein
MSLRNNAPKKPRALANADMALRALFRYNPHHMDTAEDGKIHFALTKDEFRELLMLVLIGNHVRNSALEVDHAYDPNRHEVLEGALLRAAGKLEAPYVRSHEGHYDPTPELEMEYVRYIEDFIDDTFWDELEVRLGKRDFDRTMTEEDDEYLEEHDGRLPPRAHAIYKRYHEEFDKYGIDRLEVNKNAPVVSEISDLM